MTLTDFITFSLVAGARRNTKMMGVYKMGDDFEYDEFSDVER
jgi:hypothetical protein